MVENPLVCVVDDDESVREALPDLLQAFGFSVQAFSSAEAFLSSTWIAHTKCLVLDMAMPGMTGPELQRELIRRRAGIPVVFITARASAAARTGVIDASAIACLIKPFKPDELIDAINTALARS